MRNKNLTENQLHNIINRTVNHMLHEADFKQVDNIQDYIKQNNLTSRRAYKNAPVNMQSGSDYVRQYIRNHPELSREEIRTIIKNGAPLETIASDGTKETDNVVTRNHRVVNNVGTPDNRWAVTDDFFDKTYSQGNDGAYNPTGAYRDAYQVNEPINIPTPWGDTMNIDKGGYIFRNPDNGKGQEEWYGISGRDFDNSYKFQENKKHKNKLIENNMKNKKVVRLTEGQLHDIITESVYRILQENEADEAYNHLQYANLAGQADGALSTFGGKLRGMFDKKWKERKERQKALFGRAAQGSAPDQNYMKNADIRMYSADNDSRYNNDYYYQKFQGAYPSAGDKPIDKNNPFVMRRSQFNQRGTFDKPEYGKQNGEIISYKDFQQRVRDNVKNKKGYMDDSEHLAFDSDYYKDSDFKRTNRHLNDMYKNGRENAMGKIKKDSTTSKDVSLYGTGTKNGLFKDKGKGNVKNNGRFYGRFLR